MQGYLGLGVCHSSALDAMGYMVSAYGSRPGPGTDLVPRFQSGVDYSAYVSPAPVDVPFVWQQRQGGSTSYPAVATFFACEIDGLRLANMPQDDYQSLFAVVLTAVLFGSAIRAVFRAIS